LLKRRAGRAGIGDFFKPLRRTVEPRSGAAMRIAPRARSAP
jgi:hypothetical protein